MSVARSESRIHGQFPVYETPVIIADAESSEQKTAKQFVEIGPDNLEWVALDSIHLLQQVRQEYDQGDIEALAHSIIRDNEALAAAKTPEEISAALQLIHPLTLNRLQPETANAYLQEHARFYELERPEIMPETHGPTIVNIAGHRRYLALEFIIVKLKGMSLSDVQVLAQVHDSLPFPEALALQLRENVKTNPPPQDEAKSIDRFYRYVAETTGTTPTYVEVANRIGFRPGKVRDALAFRELPESIQHYVGLARNGSAIPYSTLVQFMPLQNALRARYEYRHASDSGYTDEARDEDTMKELHIMANKIAEMRLQRRGADKIDEVLKGQTRLVQGEVLVTAETLFAVEGDDVTSRRRRSSNNLAGQAILVLQLLARQGQLSETHKQALDRLNGQPATEQTPLF